MASNPVETKVTKYEGRPLVGVYKRHPATCALARDGKRCSCGDAAKYIARLKMDGRQASSGVVHTLAEAVNWRRDKESAVDGGERIAVQAGTVAEMIDKFVGAERDGLVTNKKRKGYKVSARRDVLQALDGRVRDKFGTTPVEGLKRKELQTWLDELYREGLSGSRIRTLYYALVALYKYARKRHDVENLPTAGIDLPPMNETQRGWGQPGKVPEPRELDVLLSAIAHPDKVVFAIAAWTAARKQEILNLDWRYVDFDLEQLWLADGDSYEKSQAANRLVPMIAPLKSVLRGEWMRQGQPSDGLVCQPLHPGSKHGKLSVEALYVRCDKVWEDAGLTPLRLHVARHACSSYLRAAGVDLKVRTAIMGHASTSSLSMTEDRYTHLMADDLDRAKRALAAYLATGTEGS